MRLKHLLLTTAATAALAVSGFAQAQQSTPPGGGADKSAPPAASQSAPPSGSQSMPSSRGASSSGSLSSGGSASTAGLHEIDDDKAQVQSLNMSAKDLGDMDIHTSDGQKIGEVNKLLADSSSQVKAVTVDVGGFLGIGGREVAIPINKLQKGEGKKLQTSMTKAEIEQLAEWKDADDDRARRDATPGRAPGSTPPATTR